MPPNAIGDPKRQCIEAAGVQSPIVILGAVDGRNCSTGQEFRMAENRKSAANARTALSRSFIFGPVPVLPGEDPAAYDELLAQVSSCLKPADMAEEIWLHDCVYLNWQILRSRRHKESLTAAVLASGIRGALQKYPDLEGKQINALIKGWCAAKPSAIKRIEKILLTTNRTLDAVVAYALSNEMDRIERLDRLIRLYEGRRNAALRELDRYRASSAQKLREQIHQLEDILFERIESGPIAPEAASIKGPS